jgi:5-methylcytosine-specific restriction protein A
MTTSTSKPKRPKLQTMKPRVQELGGRLQAVSAGSWRTTKQSSTARGYGYKWQQARERYLSEHPFCAYCLRDAGITATALADIGLQCLSKGLGLPYASVVDHIRAHRGDMALFWDETNWQGLCRPHHDGEKKREENAEQQA